jgi:hypothetical protein
MTANRPTKAAKCDLYIAGHCSHPIQCRKAAGTKWTTAILVGIEDGVITVEHMGTLSRFRSHDAQLLEDIAPVGTPLRFYESFRLLGVDLGRASWKPIYIADADDQWVPCDNTPITSTTPEALAERLQTHGGLLMPGTSIEGFE